jgi:hypothetical protein
LRKVAVDAGAVEELSDASPDNRFLVDGVGDAQPRLEIPSGRR